MNIYFVENDYNYCAQVLDNKRLCKNILEIAQILNAAAYNNGVLKISLPFKPTGLKHPCVQWAARSKDHYNWLINHLIYLTREYTYRYDQKRHKYEDFIGMFNDFKSRMSFHSSGWANPPNLTDFQDEPNVCLAYKRHLLNKWNTEKHTPIWFYRQIPCWRMPEDRRPVESPTVAQNVVSPFTLARRIPRIATALRSSVSDEEHVCENCDGDGCEDCDV